MLNPADIQPVKILLNNFRGKALGPDHPDVATNLENLAGLYRATERDKEALELENNAERIRAIKR